MAGDASDPISDRLGGRLGRRRLLAGGAALGAAAALGVGQAGRVAARPEDDPSAGLAAVPASEEPELIVRSSNPLQAETPLWALEGLITPNRLFFVRDHFPPGQIAAAEWQPRVEGHVERPFMLTFDQLRQLPARRLVSLIECAGNSRGRFQPAAEGIQWGNGAISTAEWIGVPLAMVLDMAGVRAGAQNVVVYGGERGNFARGLPIDKAYDPDTILAYAMNGEPLPTAHGAPVRLVVPGWIGVASVKWVGRIEVIDTPYEGPYNTQRYVYEYPDVEEKRPVTLLGVKSAIVRPAPEAVLQTGTHVIAGYAWSGHGPIRSVDVSSDNWQTSQPAQLMQSEHPWAWTRFELSWTATQPGRYTLASRATDAAGNVQPESVTWNRFGYGMNAIYSLDVIVQ